MNAFDVATPRSMVAGNSERVIGVARDRQGETVVDGAVPIGRGAPFRETGQERALRGRGRAGTRIIEGEKRRRAPMRGRYESWKKRSGSISVATRVWVWTSTAPGRTSIPVASITRSALAAAPTSRFRSR